MIRELIMTTLLAQLSSPPLVYPFAADLQQGNIALGNCTADPTKLIVGMPLNGAGVGEDVTLATTTPPTMSEPAIASGSQITIHQGFRTIGRRLLPWAKVPDQPAVFLVEGNDEYPPRPSSAPARVGCRAFVWIYNRTRNDAGVPGTALNALIDAIEAVLTPPPNSPTGVWQNLGLGSVIHCRIEGEVLKDLGHLDGQGLARVPLIIQVAQGQITRSL